jgi:hypothetical protein
LRHVNKVAVVFGVEDQVHKKLPSLSYKGIRRRRELKICSFQEC